MRIMSTIKSKVRKLVLGYKASSNDYIAILRSRGAVIGKNVKIYSPFTTNIDLTTPWMLNIGDDVIITGPVTILTHDYSTHIPNAIHQSLLAAVRPVTIGSNVFLGWGCTILPGAAISDNTIIGAGAIVGGKLEPNSVYAGNPARRLMSIEEFYEKQKNRQINDAVIYYQNLKK